MTAIGGGHAGWKALRAFWRAASQKRFLVRLRRALVVDGGGSDEGLVIGSVRVVVAIAAILVVVTLMDRNPWFRALVRLGPLVVEAARSPREITPAAPPEITHRYLLFAIAGITQPAC